MAIPLDAQYVDVPIFNQLVPGEGPKTIRIQVDFSVTDAYTVDMTNAIETGIIKAVQTLYIDTTEADQNVVFTMGRTEQRLIINPNIQGYFPVLLPNPPQFTIASQASAGSIVRIQMINVPMAAHHWSVTP